MKKGKLFLALGLSFAFVFGLGKVLNNHNEINAVKADAPTYSGSFFVQKNDNDMKYTGSKLVAHFFDNDSSHTGWAEAVWNTEHTYQKYDWSFDFEPTKFIVLRVDGNSWSLSNPWSNVWSRTGNMNLAGSDVVWMKGTANENNSDWGTYSMETLIMDDNNVQLGELADKKVKPNGEGLEAFGRISFSANQKFYVKKTIDGDTKYNNYSCLDLISGNLRYFGEYIEVLEAATYELYFDFNGNTTYLTDPAVAEADEWSQAFLGTECSDSKGAWGTFAGTYANLSAEAKAILLNKEHIDKDAEVDTEITRAVQRYDYVLQRFGVGNANTDEGGYEDFMGRISGGKLSLAPVGYRNSVGEEISDSNLLIAVFTTIGLLAAATGYLVVRIRRNNQINN